MSSGGLSKLEPSEVSRALRLISSMDTVSFEKFSIVGNYLRFDQTVRHSLKDARQRIVESLDYGRGQNLLLWGAPGSGKSYFVQEIANSLKDRILYTELNLAQLAESDYIDRLEKIQHTDVPQLVLVDEIDAKPDESWPNEALLSYLDRSNARSRQCWILAGSSGSDPSELRENLGKRPKGIDLLSRMPSANDVTVPQLEIGDRLIVGLAQLANTSRGLGHNVREVEKLALLYLAIDPKFSSARQIRDLVNDCAGRIPPGEDRIKFDYLFRAGDAVNKEFWLNTRPLHDELVGKYVMLESLGQKVPTGPSQGYAKPENLRTEMVRSTKDRIAVLPLVNMSSQPDDEYFADGLTEELITKLSRVPGLKVIARTSIMNYKRKEKSIREIGKELEVSSVIEGSVRKSGNRIRVTVQLINPITEEHVWASQYDRTIDDIFAIQTEIAEKTAEALTVRAPREQRPDETSDVTAYTLFMRANQLLHGVESWSESSLREALSLFNQAVERNPRFARAYAGIARTWFNLGNGGYENWTTMNEKGKSAAIKSIEFGPEEAEAHLALAQILMAEDEFESTRAELQEALRLNPNLADAYTLLGEIQLNLDGPDVASKTFGASLELDPFSLESAGSLALALNVSGRKPQAFNVLQKLSQIYPTNPWPHILFARHHLWNGEHADVQKHLHELSKIASTDPSVMREQKKVEGILYALTGKRSEAERIIDHFRGVENEVSRLQGIFVISASLGDLDLAFECLFPLADLGAWWIGVKYISYYSPLREDPRYKDFCRKVGIQP